MEIDIVLIRFKKLKISLILYGEQQKRTLKDHCEKLEKNKHSSNHGYRNKRICKNLEYDEYVIEILHLFFRVGDVLFQLLLNELC
jgi:hypothetical protein